MRTKLITTAAAIALLVGCSTTDGGIADYADRDNRNPAAASVDRDQSPSSDRASPGGSGGSGQSGTRHRPLAVPPGATQGSRRWFGQSRRLGGQLRLVGRLRRRFR